jgi:L-gulonate 3-dehydrogenase
VDPDNGADASALGPVAVVGAGGIGVAWTVVFAVRGVEVRLHDAERLSQAPAEAAAVLDELAVAGPLSDPGPHVLGRVTTREGLDEAVAGVTFVPECIVEDVAITQELVGRIDELSPIEPVLASSTSTILPSASAQQVVGRRRCPVFHAGNPPYFLEVAEVVPAPFTSPETVRRAVEMVEALAMSPVVLAAEIEGFAFKRLPGALLREAYCLLRDGIVSPVDVRTVMREGLGLRSSVAGPLATNALNTRGGLRHHAEQHGRARGQTSSGRPKRPGPGRSRRSRPRSGPTCHMRSGPTMSRSVIAR